LEVIPGGAKKFVQSGINPELDFIVEFDRKNGNDAVFYGCDNDEFVKFVEQFEWKKTYGTCIPCYLYLTIGIRNT